MVYGFVKVAAAVPVLQVADCEYNVEQIEHLLRRAAMLDARIVVFPELSVTGYSCMDLFMQDSLQRQAVTALFELARRTRNVEALCIVGMPLAVESRLMNTAAVIQKGKVLGFVPKTCMSNYGEYQERRWFSPAGDLSTDRVTLNGGEYPVSANMLFTCGKVAVGIELCEDLWTPVPPSSLLAMQGANILVNLSASNELTGKHEYVKSLVRQQSARCIAGYIYAAAGFGESSTDLVFAGKGFIAENGTLLGESERFPMREKLLVGEIDIDYLHHDRLVTTSFAQEARRFVDARQAIRIPFSLPDGDEKAFARPVDPHPFVPSSDAAREERCNEIFNIQVNALARRMTYARLQAAVVGVSGGLDSTLALLVTAMTFDAMKIPRAQIAGVTMPGFGTTPRTHENAVRLIRALGVTRKEISIVDACTRHLADIGHDGKTHDTTFENAQARERTQILMDLANKLDGLMVGTGDLSELALGWTTYGGDHISMYAVNAGIPKTLVRHLVEWIALHRVDGEIRATLLDIVDTPISPELIPANKNGDISQKTEELVGPYELHDFFLYHFMRYGASPAKIYFLARTAFKKKYAKDEIKKWMRIFFSRFFAQQFKRNCLPDGPKVGSVSLSPRCDWRMPSDASAALWLKEIDKLP
ncbi:MAG: NAD(+) synthase [Tannerella sp.]|jgi:NAD+ synthase (glutamine-hydrolysing)|nr:NAD(+) synthase [Tannerella sp.]